MVQFLTFHTYGTNAEYKRQIALWVKWFGAWQPMTKLPSPSQPDFGNFTKMRKFMRGIQDSTWGGLASKWRPSKMVDSILQKD
jgi:hypothetical protein